MSLRGKALVSLFVAGAASLVMLVILCHVIVMRGYEQLEDRDARTNVRRTAEAVKDKIESIHGKTYDWAVWDDTYEYVETRDKIYVERNLTDLAISGMEMSVVVLVKPDGERLFDRWVVSAEEAEPVKDEVVQAMRLHRWPAESIGVEGWSGVLRINDRALLASIRPIVRSDESGEPRGLLLMGQVVDEKIAEYLTERMRVPVRVAMVEKSDQQSTQTHDKPLAEMGEDGEHVFDDVKDVKVINSKILLGRGQLKDEEGKPVISFEVELKREIYAAGSSTTWFVMWAAVGVAVMCGVSWWWGLEYWVIRRVGRLSREIKELGLRAKEVGGVTVEGEDELSQLARRINEMLEALSNNQMQIKEQIKYTAELARVADAANQAKSSFLANMSHEIRTPLTAVMGYAELLRSDPNDLPMSQAECLEAIESNSRHLLNLINDVLDLAKVESGKLQLEITATDMHSLVRQAMSVVTMTAEKKGLTLELTGADVLPRDMPADGFRLKQVLINLLSNAVKFTREGKVTVDAESDGKWLILSVKDSGIGMTAQQMKKMFQPFTQADASTTRQFGGTGLGLSISKKLIEAMGGTITLESELGKGSTFAIKLPTRPAGKNAQGQEDKPSSLRQVA